MSVFSSKWSHWFYFPSQPVAWLSACLAAVGLSFLKASPLRLIELPEGVPSVHVWLVATGSFILNLAVLWMQMRHQYLTGSGAIRPFAVTFVLLSGAFTGVEGHRLRTSVPAATLGHAIAGGQLLFTSVLLFTALWRTRSGLDDFLASRALAVRLLERVCEDGQPLSAHEKQQLLSALRSLRDYRHTELTTGDDERRARCWQLSTTRLVEYIEPIPGEDLVAQAKYEMQQSLAVLRSTR
jgi:hypothetical protein